MIGLEALYVIGGAFFAAVAVMSARDASNPKRWKNTAFWGLFAASFLFGSHLPDFANGLIVIAMVAVAGFGGLGRGEPQTTGQAERTESAARLGNRLFLPALAIPATALAGTFLFKRPELAGLVDPKQATLVSLILGVFVALAIAMPMLRAKPATPLQEGRRLLDTVGWAAVLPQMLAALGAVFAAAGVGAAIGQIASQWLPDGSQLAAVAAYTFGMAIFTMIMGNAFAAFPVMTAGIGLPLIVQRFGGDPAIMGAIGMLSGFCGTLMTPMAANFNIVPAALLELKDRNGVIRAQVPTALILLLANTALMYALVFRF
ncbi:hypothetical protein ASE17_09790 [Phenylobacterium sp. Root77]|uniref:DUF979 domain-containing protein n=1 Tax=unclassified Phenylobacterium TaxID=2640670 RepID=UPI0006F62095|nr:MULTISPECIES: DUF979 domain-containing protein [unclassified Phenylobacterium]KQW73221.1 hypothetical protein ASC73_02360 [Phenylobacterium sp. Root1277]KQW92441.1 hypothetical protein ASC79_13070 [Phenylobacterium sp. Root1290]KRC40670.1 hypothetical protein ASE17_09790 [Phenylobacterium sp. Root77]